jgi:DNA-binding IclR family transcriptional regulator
VNTEHFVQNTEQITAAPQTPSTGTKGVAVIGVDRVLDVFEAFNKVQKPLSLTDLADITGIPKSSCHAIVRTLIARGYLYSLNTRRALYPTRRLFDIAREIHEKDPFVERVMPLLERLRDASRETVILGKRQGDAVIYLQVVESTHSIRYSAKPGEFKPLHCSAVGKALMGSMKEADLRAQIAGLAFPAVTGTTLTDPQTLTNDILAGRKRGYFVSQGENVADVWAVSAFLAVNSETLAIAIAGPRHRIESNVIECAQLVSATCSFISRNWSHG